MQTTEASTPPAVSPADIKWQNGHPVSEGFGDIYLSHGDGLVEARQIFLTQNNISRRFQTVGAGESCVIAEAGFGIGLNFLAAWQAWQQTRTPEGAVLHFISTERYPVSHQDLSLILCRWPELQPLVDQLLAHYPPAVSGLHRRQFDGGQVRLTLYFGDTLPALDDMVFRADAWFLTGRAAVQNHGWWGPELADTLSLHSNKGCTLVADSLPAADTLAALASAGFETQPTSSHQKATGTLVADWRPRQQGSADEAAPPSRSVTVIGAGVGGSLLARNLAERGWSVTVLDRANSPGSGASGNSQGALYVKLGVDFNHQTKLALSSLLYSQHFYTEHASTDWHQTGLLQLAWNPQEADRQARFCERNNYPECVVRPVDCQEAGVLTGSQVKSGGLWFEGGGWLQPKALCQQMLNHPNIQCHFGFQVTRIMPCNGRWHISGQDSPEWACERLVLCAGDQTPVILSAFADFRFKRIRGQVTQLPAFSLQSPKAVVCGPCYVNPAHAGYSLTGASFDLHDPCPDIKLKSHADNLDQLESILPDIWTTEKPCPESLDGRVAFRCTTHDYQPAVGALTDQGGQTLEGIDMLTGLGSKGLTYAPLLAEYLADEISGQPRALPRSLITRLLPDRCRVPAQRQSA
ncbi:FAD-dependent 5-carboxymethylaminomethyl-2-thiouridine(34) oxidoreductase MnmC [Marinobacter caseinilyticus]|uniref:FAD-dependent 5-carboxymethylaminomethyl-2-thiouridine(34) oxidoreductase MnmC n=1 Tax=Marinobacter caseinilyticus TaxID=2692195 RepID=UPI00140C20FB|nr:FAD-dependent 5-carboxymethylaminomethyl-2-thiouridine(34) oxidoreductase MnmC [Marinobacter caseinilyticus]